MSFSDFCKDMGVGPLFKDERMKDMPLVDHVTFFGMAAWALGEAAKAQTEDEAWAWMDTASRIGHPFGSELFNSLYGKVAKGIAISFK